MNRTEYPHPAGIQPKMQKLPWKKTQKSKKNREKNSLKREKERKRGGRKRREGHAPPSPIDILFGPRFGCQVIREKTSPSTQAGYAERKRRGKVHAKQRLCRVRTEKRKEAARILRRSFLPCHSPLLVLSCVARGFPLPSRHCRVPFRFFLPINKRGTIRCSHMAPPLERHVRAHLRLYLRHLQHL